VKYSKIERSGFIRYRRQASMMRSIAVRVLVPILLIVLTILCGSKGFRDYYAEQSSSAHVSSSQVSEEQVCTWSEAFWLATGLPLGETTSNPEVGSSGSVNHWLHMGRLFGYLVLAYAFMMVAAELFRPGFRWLRILWWSHCCKKYAVVCGLGWRGQEIVLDLLMEHLVQRGAAKWRIVVLDPINDNPLVRDIEGARVAVLNDSATSRAILRGARVTEASRIFVVAGNDELNSRIVHQLSHILEATDQEPCIGIFKDLRESLPGKGREKREKMLRSASQKLLSECANCGSRKPRATARIFVHTDNLTIRDLLGNTTGHIAASMECFNTHESTARLLLKKHPLFLSSADTKNVHLVLFGDSPMARMLALRLMQMMHIGKGRKVVLSLVVPDVDAVKKRWYAKHTCLDKGLWRAPGREKLQKVASTVFGAVDFYELPGSTEGLLDRDFILYNYAKDTQWITHAFFCVDNGVESFNILNSCKDGIMACEAGCRTNFFHYYNYPEGELGEQSAEPLWRDIDLTYVRFGSFLESCSLKILEDRIVSSMAKQFFAVFGQLYSVPEKYFFRKRCPTNYEELTRWFEQRTLFQDDQESADLLDPETEACVIDALWNRCPEWMQNSNQQAADHLLVKLQEMGIDVNEASFVDEELLRTVVKLLKDEELRTRLAEMEHRRWCAERLLKAARYHGDLVPFDELSKKEEHKDDIAVIGLPFFINTELRKETSSTEQVEPG